MSSEIPMEEMKAIRKAIKQAKRDGTPITQISNTAFGMVIPGAPLPEGVPSNFALKQKAHLEFLRRLPPPQLSANRLGNMRGEAAYLAYYNDLIGPEREIWLRFFDAKGNLEHAEHTCGILGTLATVLRQRGKLIDCEKVLDIEALVLERYEAACDPEGHNPSQMECYDTLKYKYEFIRFNLCLHTNRFKECADLYRTMAGHELKYKYTFDAQNCLWMVKRFLGKRPTARTLRNLSSNQIRKMIKKMVKELPGGVEGCEHTKKSKKRVALLRCAVCNKEEPALSTFQRCAGCKKVVYCGRECQKNHWKAHKAECCKPQSSKPIRVL